jgi:methylmalonyl-CoA mutase C-terminal domain/subunit
MGFVVHLLFLSLNLGRDVERSNDREGKNLGQITSISNRELKPHFLLTFTLTNSVCMSNTFNRPIRVLVAKVGLDGHDRGARIIATSLRDAGMEVIYTGLRQTPEMVVNTALQEDVDAIGISILSGAHMTVFPKIIQLIKDKQMDDVLVTGGGIIPESDMQALKKIGVGELFPPGTTTKDIVQYITDWVHQHRNF